MYVNFVNIYVWFALFYLPDYAEIYHNVLAYIYMIDIK